MIECSIKFRCGDRVTIDQDQIDERDDIAARFFGLVGEVLNIEIDSAGTWCHVYFPDVQSWGVPFLQEELKKVPK